MDRIVANVNGEIILLSDVRSQMALLKGVVGESGRTTGKVSERDILDAMVEEKIVAHYAKENNVIIKESEIDKAVENIKRNNNFTDKILEEVLKREGLSIGDYREKMKNQMMIQRITSMEAPGAEVSDGEVRGFYEDNRELFMKPGRVRASHIILLAKENDMDAEKESRGKLIGILTEVKSGADFYELAKKYSQDGSSKSGGDLGWFLKGQMLPEFEKKAFSMQVGEVSDIVRTKYGFHIIKVTGKEEPTPVAFEDIKDRVINSLKEEKFREKRKAWLDGLRAKAYVEIKY